MSKVFVNIGLSLDGYMAPQGMTIAHWETPEYKGWSALAQARTAAGGRDVRIAGGADVVQQYLTLGVVDELEIALTPVLFGGGRRLFENMGEPAPQWRIAEGPERPGRHPPALRAGQRCRAQSMRTRRR
jgi:hypothetical protein